MNALERIAANKDELLRAGMNKRIWSERIFQAIGIGSIMLGLIFLVVLLSSITLKGAGAFTTYDLRLDVTLDNDILELPENPTQSQWLAADYEGLIKQALREKFPEVTSRSEKRMLYPLISTSAGYQVRDFLMAHPEKMNTTQSFWLTAGADSIAFMKGYIDPQLEQADRRFKDNQIQWLKEFQDNDDVDHSFNLGFFTSTDSREPEQAGLRGAITGSLFTMLVTLVLSFPIGVAAAIYLEEFAKRNKLTEFIEINIANLAAVPSIVFGLLGAAIFINVMHLPRAAPIVGGLVLTLMTLPTIIIASRAAIKAVPPSIRDAAMGIGASKMQVVLHHVLPLAMPGMLTGTIIGMAQALGETAPLLMIGMVAFIVDIPGSITDSATVLPVQIYMWSDLPERLFVEKTSGAILVLLMFLACMNILAVILRKKFERKW
ncbi:phosphate ABC transporter permease PstA [Marinicellulosiphila megalodicopiae]|uniref:phosphate ABC transporter permease PstA n=1 Tax=Marinicellulosiphila megalodicopiae TaxID=2724896 RepID=UPI003BB17FFC